MLKKEVEAETKIRDLLNGRFDELVQKTPFS